MTLEEAEREAKRRSKAEPKFYAHIFVSEEGFEYVVGRAGDRPSGWLHVEQWYKGRRLV